MQHKPHDSERVLAPAAQEEANRWSMPRISGWKSKASDSTQCWINTYFLNFFLTYSISPVACIPTAIEDLEITFPQAGRNQSCWSDPNIFPSSRDKCPLLWPVSLRERKRPKASWSRERKAFPLFNTIRFPVTPGITSKLCWALLQHAPF